MKAETAKVQIKELVHSGVEEALIEMCLKACPCAKRRISPIRGGRGISRKKIPSNCTAFLHFSPWRYVSQMLKAVCMRKSKRNSRERTKAVTAELKAVKLQEVAKGGQGWY